MNIVKSNLIMVFLSKDYADDVASLGIEWLECDNKNIIEISNRDYNYLIANNYNVPYAMIN